MKVFTGDNTSNLYLAALNSLFLEGDEVAPKGMKIKELRPVCFEFTNPLNRVTFVRGRRINPFFQLAEALWIISGRSDVKWLTNFNANMGQFSDDGVYFNAPYGERLRTWNQSRANDFIFNPIDQLHDVYAKICKDNETRQAVAVIYNPMFDNFNYTGKDGKDIPCNLILTFKLRNGKLDLTVYNRSNDIHWGVFGANLVQFATIQEMMATWLSVEVGTYRQITDSLHVYLDDFGSKCTDLIAEKYEGILDSDTFVPNVEDFGFTNPRFTSNINEMDEELMKYWTIIDPVLSNDESFQEGTLSLPDIEYITGVLNDEYLQLTVKAMFAYRYFKLGNMELTLEVLESMEDSQWKVSCLYFLADKLIKAGYTEKLHKIISYYPVSVKNYILGL